MKTLRLALAGAVAVVVALIATLGPALSYPLSHLEVTGGTLIGGNQITVTATAAPTSDFPDEKCMVLSITYVGETVTATNTNSFSHTFDTRKVTKVESDPVTAECTYQSASKNQALGGGSAGKLGTSLATAVESIGADNTITLLPLGGGEPDDNGLLPNTGGERLAWLLIGGLLVLVGGGAIAASRRRTP